MKLIILEEGNNKRNEERVIDPAEIAGKMKRLRCLDDERAQALYEGTIDDFLKALEGG